MRRSDSARVTARGGGASPAWRLGWLAGLAVVVIAATLLVTLIALARRITGQAEEIADAIEGARRNTDALFDVPAVNLQLDRITRELRSTKEAP